MSDLSFLLLIALVSIGIGFALGSLVTGARGERGEIEKDKTSAAANLIQVAGIMTDRSGKTVYLQVEGKAIRSVLELNRQQRSRLQPFIETIASWFGVSGGRKPSMSPAGKAAETPEQVGALQLEATESASVEALRPSMNPVNVLARAIRSDVSLPPPAKSIVVQIDEILQEKLKGTPLENRGIRLMELPSKGMVVMVGLNQYEGVDQVPDDDVKGVIRAAVSEWENSISQ